VSKNICCSLNFEIYDRHRTEIHNGGTARSTHISVGTYFRTMTLERLLFDGFLSCLSLLRGL
jgi:hypothetical protein